MFGFVRKSLYDEAIKQLSEKEYSKLDAARTEKVLRNLWYRSADVVEAQREELVLLAAENQRLQARLYASQLSKSAPGATFTPDELRSLLQLVHPDKHGGKESAVRLTQKINALRK